MKSRTVVLIGGPYGGTVLPGIFGGGIVITEVTPGSYLETGEFVNGREIFRWTPESEMRNPQK